MASDETSPRTRSLGKNRMEALSDGVFSIAATLLVLELALHPPGSALEQLFRAWPSYVAYLISFGTIGAAWLMHAAITERLSRADAILLRLNLLLLLTVAFLPFPTLLVGAALRDPDSERVFVTLFGVTLMSIRLLGFAMDAYCRREHLYSPVEDDQDLRRDRRTLRPVLAVYVIAILVGLALPVLAVAVYFGLAVYLVVPFREVRGLLFPRR